MQLLEHREFPLLYVDDEPDNLRIFELTFQREFSILTATNAEEGLALLNENPVASCSPTSVCQASRAWSSCRA